MGAEAFLWRGTSAEPRPRDVLLYRLLHRVEYAKYRGECHGHPGLQRGVSRCPTSGIPCSGTDMCGMFSRSASFLSRWRATQGEFLSQKVVSLFLCKGAGRIEKATAICQIVSEQARTSTTKAEVQWAPLRLRLTTRRSESCSRATEGWLFCWSRPENQILQAEMTFCLGAKSGERTDD